MHSTATALNTPFSLPILYDVDTQAEAPKADLPPSPTAHLRTAQTDIGTIVDQGIEVPGNIKDLLAPIAGHTVEELLGLLRGIDKTSCLSKHEYLAATTPLAKGYNFVANCGKRPRNGECGHQGIRALEYAAPTPGGMDRADSDTLNNPIAKIQFALALVLAIGNHNAEATVLMDKAIDAARIATATDKTARHYYLVPHKGEPEPSLEGARKQHFPYSQKYTGERVLALRDKVLKMLTDDVALLEDPAFERQKSGALNSNIGKIEYVDAYGSPPIRSQVNEMFR